MNKITDSTKSNIKQALNTVAVNEKLRCELSNKSTVEDVYDFMVSISGGYTSSEFRNFLNDWLSGSDSLTDNDLSNVYGGVTLSVGKRFSFLLVPLIITLNGTATDSYIQFDNNGTENAYTTIATSVGNPQNSRDTIAPSKKIIDVPYINQDKVVYGCEAVSTTMLLKYYGYDISEKEFTDKYLIKKNWSISQNGKVYGPDPNAAYPGNPYVQGGLNCGFGAYAPAIAKSTNKILNPGDQAVVKTGMSLSDLITKYIDNYTPVLIWATMDMEESKLSMSWSVNYIDENSKYKIGDIFTWVSGEHCLVLVGYDDDNYYFNDPYQNHGLIGYSKEIVEKRFDKLGKQSVVIERN